MHVPRQIADRGFFGAIRAFTTTEIARMVNEIARVESVVAQKASDLAGIRWNPLNYILQTQRDAIARMEDALAQDRIVLDQMKSSRDAVIESGDTDKLQAWFDLSATVGDAGDLRTWREQVKFAKTSETVSTVASQTAAQIKSPFGVPWWVYAGALGAIFFLGRRR